MIALEILKNKETYEDDYPTVSISDATEAMIEFAKIHVQQALKQVANKFGDQIGGREGWGNELIEGVYTLDNIK